MESKTRKPGAMKKPVAKAVLANGKEANLESMQRVADLFGIDPALPPETLLTELRKHVKDFAAMDRDSIVDCNVCDETSTLETTYCPFCGSDGLEEDVVEVTPNENPTTAKLQAGHDARVAELAAEEAAIEVCVNDLTNSMYELGQHLLKVREEKLWAAKGHASFRKWITANTKVSQRYADQIADIAKNYTKEQYLLLGTAKLSYALRIEEPEIRNALVEQAGAEKMTLKSVRAAVDAEVPPPSKKLAPPPSDTSREAPEKERATKPKAPKQKPSISLLAKVDATPKSHSLRDPETGLPVRCYVPNAYCEIPVSADVVLRVLPVFNNDGELQRMKAAFVSVVVEAEPESDDAE